MNGNENTQGYENLYVASEDGSFFDASSGWVEVWSKHGEDYADQTGEMSDDERVVKRAISVNELVRFWETYKGPIPLQKNFDPDFDPLKD